MPSTWGGRSSFEYTGTVETGTVITYGQGFKVRVSAEQYSLLRTHFRSCVVPAGTSRTGPPRDSLGAWLQANVTRTAISSYVAAILVREGYAERVGRSEIRVTH
jgi:hypothetical protein